MSEQDDFKEADEYALATGWSCIDEQMAGAEVFAIRAGFLAGIAHGRATPDREMLRQAIRFGANWKADPEDDKCYSWDELTDQFLAAEKDLINKETK